MYKLIKNIDGNVCSVNTKKNGISYSIPINPDNSDYQIFKNDIEGVDEMGNLITPLELQDADGNTMTADDAKAYIATLP